MGRLFYEPLWVFHRADLKLTNLRDLKGKRIMVGTKTSGTRRVALQFLKANGIEGPPGKDQPPTLNNATIIEEQLGADGAALVKGEVDAAFLILPPESARVQALLHNPKLKLLSFGAEADAYTTASYPSPRSCCIKDQWSSGQRSRPPTPFWSPPRRRWSCATTCIRTHQLVDARRDPRPEIRLRQGRRADPVPQAGDLPMAPIPSSNWRRRPGRSTKPANCPTC